MTPEPIGHFQVIRRVGAGGMATVYQATDLRNNQLVALKCVTVKKEVDRERFLREIEILQGDHHPCLIRCFDHGAKESLCYAALEWVEGPDLSAILTKSALSIQDSLILIKQLAEVLAVLHSKGIVHRDIKPGNVLLPSDDPRSVRLIDLGVAFRVGGRRFTQVGLVLGTPGYLSPEQARAEANLTPQADIFSLGCLLYACLTGQSAFRGGSSLSLLVKVLVEEPTSMRSIRPEIPEGVEVLVSRMMAKQGEQRPTSTEVATALRSLLLSLSPIESATMPKVLAPLQEESKSSLQPLALTSSERRLFCLVLLSKAVTASQESPSEEKTIQSEEAPLWGQIEQLVTTHQGNLLWLADGSIALTFLGAGAALDLALRAARCASGLRRLFSLTPISISMERGDHAVVGEADLGAAIDRAAALLESPDASRDGLFIRVDTVAAGLLDARFILRGDAAGLYLCEEREAVLQTRTLLGKETPFVGRAKEIELLSRTFDAVCAQSTPRAVLLTAPSGTGKSRLAREFIQRLAHSPNPPALWVGGADAPNTPFRLLTSALRRELQVQHETLAVHQAKFMARISRFVPRQHAHRIATFLAQMLPGELSLTHSSLQSAVQDPQLYADQMLRSFLEWLSAEASEQPIVWILDDLQWADLPSMRFIERALLQIKRPLFFIGMIRPHEIERIAPHLSAWEQIELPPIPRRQAERFVREVIGDSISQQDLLQLVERAQGDAFFLEELIRSFVETRGASLPETLVAMTQARVEALPEEERKALRAASIFGERFSPDAVKFLLGGPSQDPLSSLLQKELIVSAWQEASQLSFRQDLLQKAAYQMLTDEDKIVGHQMAAQWLISKEEREPSAIAEHLERSNQSTEAGRWYRRAAQQSRNAGDTSSCLMFVKRAFACGVDDETRGLLRALEVDAFFWSSQPLKIEASAHEAMLILPKTNPERTRVIATRLMVEVQRGGASQIASLIRELQSITPPAAQAYIRSTALVLPALLVSGFYLEATHFLAHLLHISEKQTSGLLWLAQSFREAFVTANPWLHLRYAEWSITECKKEDDRRARAMATVEAGRALVGLGQPGRAIENFQAAERIANELGAAFVVSLAKPMWATALAQIGALEDAERLARDAANELFIRGNKALEATARLRLAQILLTRSKMHEAIQEGRAAVDCARRTPAYLAHAFAVLSRAYLQDNQRTLALEAAEEAASLQQKLDVVAYADTFVSLAYIEALSTVQREDEAQSALQEATQKLIRRSALIEDASLQHSFLSQIPEHQALLLLANE